MGEEIGERRAKRKPRKRAGRSPKKKEPIQRPEPLASANLYK